MVCDEDEWTAERPSSLWLRIVFVLAAVVVATVLGLFLFMGLSSVARAADTEVLLIVDQDGRELLRCVLPVTYLLPPAKAIVCKQAPLFRDGFE